jgi:hypothetical protein
LNENPSLLSDSSTVASIRNLLSTPKPPSIGPVDLLHIIRLMVEKAEDHTVYDSQITLAEAFGVTDTRTILDSQKRLVKLGWISRAYRQGRSYGLTLNVDSIPAEEPVRLKITPVARQIAKLYGSWLAKRGRKKFPKHWLEQQAPRAQRILDRCKGDVDKVGEIIQFAVLSPKFGRAASKDLYEGILKPWRKLTTAYEQQLKLSGNTPQKEKAEK